MALTNAENKYLQKKYYDSTFPASLSGPEKFYQAVKNDGRFNIPKSKIIKFLRGEHVYTTNKNIIRKFKRNRVIVDGIDTQWDMDLIDFSKYSKENDGYRYILICIDIFSRYVWARPCKTKYGAEIAAELIDIISEGRKPESIRTDSGREMTNATLKNQVYQALSIKHFSTSNELQANYAERVIKTIKAKLFRIMRKTRKFKYIEQLEKVIEGYNKTVHSSTGYAPEDVTDENEDEVRISEYLIRTKKENAIPRLKNKMAPSKIKQYKFKLNDSVRITRTRNTFDRFYDENWTGEVFTIIKRFRRQNINVYKIADKKDDELKGTFYETELQKINYDPNAEFHVKEVLETIKERGKPDKVRVSWHDWPKKFNQVILKSNLKDYK